MFGSHLWRSKLKHDRQVTLSIGISSLLFFAWGTAQAEYAVSGLIPDQRPTDAPVVEQVVKDKEWYQNALTGIETPYPYSLRFLEDQGDWYTPFIHPGMTGPYDIRGWYAK